MRYFEEILLQLKLSVLFIVSFQFLKGICYIEYDYKDIYDQYKIYYSITSKIQLV